MRGLAAALCLWPFVAGAADVEGVSVSNGASDGGSQAPLQAPPEAPSEAPSDGGVLAAPELPVPQVTPRTAAELLDHQRAVFLQRGHAGGATLALRGFAGVEAPIRDGVHRWTSSTANVLTPLTGADPFWIDRTEVTLGMSPVRHGAESLGGGVLLTAPSPDFSAHPRSGGKAIFAGGTDAPGFRGHLRGELTSEDMALLVGASAFSEGDVVGGARVGAQPYSSYEGAAAHAVLRRRFGDSAVATLRYDFQDEAFPITSLSEPLDVFRVEDSVRHALSLEAAAVRWGPLNARVAAGAQRRQGTRLHAAVPTDRLSRDTAGEWALDGAVLLGAEAELGPLGVVPLGLGLEARHDSLDAGRETGSLSGAQPAMTGALLPYPRRSTDTRGALFLTAQTDPSRRWRVEAGVRGELYAQALGADSRLATLDPAAPSRAATERTGSLFSAELGLEVAPLQGWRISARGAFTQRPPTLDEQLRVGRTDLGYQLPADGLREAQAWFGELSSGLVWGKLTLNLAYAFTSVTRPLEWGPAAVGSTSSVFDGLRLVALTNGLRARVNAVDGEARLALPGDLSLSLNGAFAHGVTLREDGGALTELPMARLPPAFGAWLVRWAPPEGHFVELAFDWALPQPRLAPVDAWDRAVCLEPGPCSAAESYTALHLRGGVRLTRHLTVSAVVQNLANATYRRHPSALAEPGLSGRISLEGSL